MLQARNQTRQRSRHAPLDHETALKRAFAWVEWIKADHKIVTRDMKRIREAFCVVSDKKRTDPYAVTVRQAHALGGKKLTAILALAAGKPFLRDRSWRRRLGFRYLKYGARWHKSRRWSS